MDIYNSLFLLLVLVALLYVLVLCAVLADLISGVRKARQRGEARTSKALRRTVNKLAGYYNVMWALTVVDLMLIGALTYLRHVEGVDSIPIFPIFTLIGALGIAGIEVKSICEKADDKRKNEYRDAARFIASHLNDRVIDAIKDILLKNEK